MKEFFIQALEFSQYIDTCVLLTLNGFHTPFLDTVMEAASMRTIWIPLYVLLFIMVWRRYGWRGAVLALLAVGLGVAVADQICGQYLRHLVCRMRPSNPDNPISQWVYIVNNYRGGKYGFPSCHAANTAVVATLLSLWLKRRRITLWLFGWAALVSLSRIYLGVHYPGDVLLGFALGTLTAYGIWRLLLLGLPHAQRSFPALRLPMLRRLA